MLTTHQNSDADFVDSGGNKAALETSTSRAAGRGGRAPEAKDEDTAFRKAMEKQVLTCALTVKHTSVPKEELLGHLKAVCEYARVGHELHKEQIEGHPDDHLHAHLQLIKQTRLKQIYAGIEKAFSGRYYGRPDVRALDGNVDRAKWNNYCKKDGDYVDHGEMRLPGPARRDKSDEDALFKEFLQISETAGEDAAMAHARANMPTQYCTRYGQMREAAASVAKPTFEKFELPEINPHNTKLRPFQRHVVWLVDCAPIARRIIWVHGPPGDGKTHLGKYLQRNYRYGFYSAGQAASYDNVVYDYREEGIICWDFPLNFDWETKEIPFMNVVEKFSDFGQELRSHKYKGRTAYVRGHVLVFANRPSPERIAHRCVTVHTQDPSYLDYENPEKIPYYADGALEP